MKLLSKPRQRFLGAALLLLLFLTACGAPLPGESWGNISTDGRYVYVAYKENIFRVNPKEPPTGDRRVIEWLAKVPGNAHVYAAPAIADDKKLYIGAYDSKLYEFSQAIPVVAPVALGSTPAEGRYQGGALVVGDVIYIGMGDRGLRAYDRKTQNILWSFTDTKQGVWSTPVLGDDTLYFTSLDHYLYALNPANGQLRWKVDLGGAVAGTPLYDQGFLFVGNFSNELLEINVKEQKVENRFKAEGWVWGTPVILKTGEREILYFGDLSGWLYALDPNTWELVWKKNDPEHPGAIRGKVALVTAKDKQVVIAGSESKFLYAYDALTGQPFWTNPINGIAGLSTTATAEKILSDLVVIGNDVIFTTLATTQMVVAYDVATGIKSWEVNLDEQMSRLQTATPLPLVTDEPTQAATDAATQAATEASQ